MRWNSPVEPWGDLLAAEPLHWERMELLAYWAQPLQERPLLDFPGLLPPMRRWPGWEVALWLPEAWGSPEEQQSWAVL